MLTLKEDKFINIVKNVTEKRGRAFSKETIKYMCTSFGIRSYQVCIKLYKDGYRFS